MGFRFRKSINLGGGFRVNLSKSGIGYSWGTKGPIPQAQVSTENYKIPPALALLAVACGIGFVVYYVSQGWSIGLSIGSGVVMGGLSYLAICFLYGAVAGGIKSATGYDIVKTAAEESTEQVQENSSVQIANDGETQIEVFEIPGAFHNRANIAKVMEPNPAWRKDILENKTIVDVSAEITGGEYKLILSEEKMVKYTVGPFIKVTVQYH